MEENTKGELLELGFKILMKKNYAEEDQKQLKEIIKLLEKMII